MNTISIGDKLKLTIYDKFSSVTKKEFNPQGMPNSNKFYYELSNEPYRFFREDFLIKLIEVKELTLF